VAVIIKVQATAAGYVRLCEQLTETYRMINIPNAIWPMLIALYY